MDSLSESIISRMYVVVVVVVAAMLVFSLIQIFPFFPALALFSPPLCLYAP